MQTTAVTGVPELDERFAAGSVLLLDGGMGTELEARGVPMDRDAWSAVANLEHAATVEQAHADYLDAGADIIIANTFAAGRFALEAAGLGERFEEANRRGVEAALRARARAAADRPVAVAGSLSPLSVGAVLGGADRSPDEWLAAYRRQVAVLVEAGVDLLVTEMIQSVSLHGLAVQAAVDTGLPTWLGVSAGRRRPDGRVPALEDADTSLDALVAALTELPVAVVAVMHTDLDAVDEALDAARGVWPGPLAAYPHHGVYDPPSWTFADLEPGVFSAHAMRWVGDGVRLVGGCCGIRPQHIRRLHDDLVRHR